MSATFVSDLDVVAQTVPQVKVVHFDPQSRSSLTVETTYNEPLRLIHVRLSDAYLDEYPKGEVSFVAGEVFHLLGAGEAASLVVLCKRIVDTCELLQEVPLDMGGQETSSWARAASGELITPPTSCQEGTFSSGIHAQLQEDMQSAIGGLHFVDHSSLGLITATLSIPLDVLSENTAEAWEVVRAEPLQVSVTFQKKEYLAGTIRVEVGQERNFKERVFSGLPGQVKLVVQRFCEAYNPNMAHYLSFVQAGVLLEDVVAASPGNGAVGTELSGTLLGGADEGRAHPPQVLKGFFNRLHQYLLHRIKGIASYCAICDHALDTGSLLCLSICSRPLCTFRFETLDVGKNFGFQAALQSGVVDLLLSFAKTAALSNRWELIFNPFPQVSFKGALVFSPESKAGNIDKVREVFKAMPASFSLLSTGAVSQKLSSAHVLAPALFQWVLSSNKSHLIKLDVQQQFSFMNTPHQFLLAMSSDDRVDRFNELKSIHGSSWAFHGSNGENWHSILRNGLKNASGTKLQVNGTAYGNGIYLSPNASTSFGYSHVASSYESASYYYGNSVKNAADPAELEGKYIHRESMICIAICEVVEHDIKKSGSVWVQPDENCVMVRYFFVYHNGFDSRGDVDLLKPDLLRIMRERSAAMITR